MMVGLTMGGCTAADVSLNCLGNAPLCDIVNTVGDGRARAGGISVTGVEVNQGVQIDLGEGGDAEIPVVAGRDALVRVFVEPNQDWEVREIAARFFILDSDQRVVGAGEGTARPSVVSEQGDLATTINIDVGGNMFPAGEWFWQVELVEAADTGTVGKAEGDRFPQLPTPIEVRDPGPPTRVYIVPVELSSGTVPRLGSEEIQLARDFMRAYNPVSDVQIEVGEVFKYDGSVADLGDLLNQITVYRDTLGLDDEVYLYGWELDNGGGLSWLAGVGGPSQRTSVGGDIRLVLVHEVGHAQGRSHSPCGGAAGPDPEYPHDEAFIGVWGYNIVTGEYIDPAVGKDYMSYCDPKWVSDFTWQGVFQRQVDLVDFYKNNDPARVLGVRYQEYWVYEDGSVRPGRVRPWTVPPQGPLRRMSVPTQGGNAVVEGIWTPFSHGTGGVLLVQAP
jgi:hypothetical protein